MTVWRKKVPEEETEFKITKIEDGEINNIKMTNIKTS